MLPLGAFLSFVQQNQLFRVSDNVLLTVSGGRDSVFMVHLFNEAKLNFGIAHCNFSLRGAESDEDEQFVRTLAGALGVPFFTTCFDTKHVAETRGISIQMAARELRYSWFEKIQTEHNYQYVATAHHLSDNTETILLNMVRGTGISGLHGIRPKRGNIIRPLLFLSRSEIDRYIQDHHIAYREDSSNASSKYARNKIRLKIIPPLEELNKDLDTTFLANSRRFAELEDFLNNEITRLRSTLFQEKKDGQICIPLAALKELKPAKLILFELLKPYGFNETIVDDLLACWDGQPGKRFHSADHLLILDRQQLILSKNAEHATTETQIEEDTVTVVWNNKKIRLSVANAADLQLNKNPNWAYFNRDLLQFPLRLRLWNKGDFFYPFGMKGKKKLSDFFTEKKIPLSEKGNIPVLVNGNGDILWIAGYRSDERYKITQQTKKVLILENLNTNEQ